MKAFRNILFLLVLAALTGFVNAGENYRQTTTKVFETPTYVLYKVGPYTMTDSTGNYYSRTMQLGGLNATDGYMYITQTEVGTEDVNYSLQYSFDGVNWINQSAADSDLDAVGTTAVTDTLGIIDGTNDGLFHNSIFFRTKGDGQTGSQQTQVTIYLYLNKSPVYHNPLPDVGRVH